MTEDQYWESDPEFNDDEFGDTYLIDEQDDIDLLILPKFKVDVDFVVEEYAKALRKCRTLDDAKGILLNLYDYAQATALIEYEIEELQHRAKSLEILADELNLR